MAFPNVLSVTRTTDLTGGASIVANLPATVDGNDLLVAVVGCYDDNNVVANFSASGWTHIATRHGDGDFDHIGVLALKATGSEDGGTVTLALSGAAMIGVAWVYRIEAGTWHDDGTLANAIAVGTAALGEATSSDPPSLDPGWGVADILWGTACIIEDQTTLTAPTNYAGNLNQSGGVDGSNEVQAGVSHRTASASSEDPSAWSWSGTEFHMSLTWAVRPSGPRTIVRYTCNDNESIAWSTVAPESGDLVLVFFANDGGDNQSTPSSPEALTRIDSGDGAADVSGGVYVRVCDGTETGDLVSTTVAAAASGFNVNTEEYGCHVLKVPASLWSGNISEVICSIKQEVTSGTINPPQVTPSWDGTAEEWTAVVFATRDDDDGISSLTANYAPNFLRTASGANGPEIASSWRALTAASEDPGSATQTGTAEAIVSVTVAIRGPIVGGTEYDETGRQITIVATVSTQDSMTYDEADRAVTIASTVTADSILAATDDLLVTVTSEIIGADIQSMVDDLLLTIASTVDVTDGKIMTEALDITVVSTIIVDDLLVFFDHGTVTVTSQIAVEDDLSSIETNLILITSILSIADVASFTDDLLTTVISTIQVVDEASFVEPPSLVLISSTVTSFDDLVFKELNMDVTGAITIIVLDASTMAEHAQLTITSTLTENDAANLVDVLDLDIVSTIVGVDDLNGLIDETGRFLSIGSVVTGHDQAQLTEALAFDAVSTLGAEDSLQITENVQFVVTATILVTDDLLSVFDETGRVLSITSTVSGADSLSMPELLQIMLDSVIVGSDIIEASDELLIEVSSILAGTDEYFPILGTTRLRFRSKVIGGKRYQSKEGFEFKGKVP